MVRGRAADKMVSASADHDLVVMPTGKSWTGRFPIGSVAEKVVSTAECWVLTVRVPRGDGNRA